MIREITENDLDGLLQLYTQLHDNPIPEKTAGLYELWGKILADPNHRIIVAVEDGKIVSSCVCVIIPNLTHEQRPYAFVENVVTDKEYRKEDLQRLVLTLQRKSRRAKTVTS